MIRDARIAETGEKNRKTGERYPPLHSKFFALKMPEPFEIKGKREKSLHSNCTQNADRRAGNRIRSSGVEE